MKVLDTKIVPKEWVDFWSDELGMFEVSALIFRGMSSYVGISPQDAEQTERVKKIMNVIVHMVDAYSDADDSVPHLASLCLLLLRYDDAPGVVRLSNSEVVTYLKTALIAPQLSFAALSDVIDAGVDSEILRSLQDAEAA
jgi:hypothetical protein